MFIRGQSEPLQTEQARKAHLFYIIPRRLNTRLFCRCPNLSRDVPTFCPDNIACAPPGVPAWVVDWFWKAVVLSPTGDRPDGYTKVVGHLLPVPHFTGLYCFFAAHGAPLRLNIY